MSELTIYILLKPIMTAIFMIGFYAGWYASKYYPGDKPKSN